jgi:putative endonuclease
VQPCRVRARVSPPWTVYMLRCRDGSLYTGATVDLERRVATHQAGRGAAYTRSRLPVALVWSEPAQGRSAALKREAALKRLTREQKVALVGAEVLRRRRAPAPRRTPAQPRAGRSQPAKGSASHARAARTLAPRG